MSNIEHWIGVRMTAGYDDEDFRDLMRTINTMRSVAEAVVEEADLSHCQHCSSLADERSFMCEEHADEADEEVQTLRDQLTKAVEALCVADQLLRQFSISAYDHSELIRREFGKAQRQINDTLSGQ